MSPQSLEQHKMSTAQAAGDVLFNGQHYNEWAISAKAVRDAKGLTGYVEGEINEPLPISMCTGETEISLRPTERRTR